MVNQTSTLRTVDTRRVQDGEPDVDLLVIRLLVEVDVDDTCRRDCALTGDPRPHGTGQRSVLAVNDAHIRTWQSKEIV